MKGIQTENLFLIRQMRYSKRRKTNENTEIDTDKK